VDPLVLRVVLVPVVRPAADLHLLDLEVVALDGLGGLHLALGAHVGDVRAHPVDQDDDVRHPPGQLPQQRQQLGLGRPVGDLARRRVHEGGVQDDRAVSGHDQGAPAQGAGLAALVALEEPGADRLHDRLRGALLGELLGDPPDPEVQLRVGVLGAVRDVRADRGVGPGGGEDRLQEGHVHGFGTTPRSGSGGVVRCCGGAA
jgi:hypothetical protein